MKRTKYQSYEQYMYEMRNGEVASTVPSIVLYGGLLIASIIFAAHSLLG